MKLALSPAIEEARDVISNGAVIIGIRVAGLWGAYIFFGFNVREGTNNATKRKVV